MRALKYWLRLARLPPGHIMTSCLNHQRRHLQNNPSVCTWLACMRRVIFQFGFGDSWDNHTGWSKRETAVFINEFRSRLTDTSLSSDLERAGALNSLTGYVKFKNYSVTSERYIELPFDRRRAIALLRFNLKYSSFMDPVTKTCEICGEVIGGYCWDHYFYDCRSMPPCKLGSARIPYPHCILPITKNRRPDLEHRLHLATSKPRGK